MESRASIHYARGVQPSRGSSSTSQTRLVRAAVLLALALGTPCWARAVAGAPERHPWRVTAAPADRSELLAFAGAQLQPVPPDSTDREILPPKGGANNEPPPAPPTEAPKPSFTLPDTMTHSNAAPLETLGPPSGNRILPAGNTPTSSTPAVHPRRGILGIHPLALLLGLVALHVFVVTTVVK